MLISALYTSNTGIQAASDFLDVVSNNVANATTTGFKLQLARLQDLAYTGAAASPPDPTGVVRMDGVRFGEGGALAYAFVRITMSDLMIVDGPR